MSAVAAVCSEFGLMSTVESFISSTEIGTITPGPKFPGEEVDAFSLESQYLGSL